MTRAALLLACLVMTGCGGTIAQPINNVRTPEGVTVGVLAEFDGIRLYQIDKGGMAYYIYVAARIDGTGDLRTSVLQSCGKNCKRTVSVDTVEAP